MNQFNIITIYPKFFESFFEHGLIKKAIENRAISINVIDLRLYTKDKHQRIDFETYGGGPGMVVQYQPVRDCLDANKIGKCYLLSPQGKTLSQKKLIDISKEEGVTFLCGRYEGLDQRIIDNLIDNIAKGIYFLGSKAQVIQNGNLSNMLRIMSFALLILLIIIMLLAVL